MARTEEGREHLDSSIKTVWASAMLHFARHLLGTFLYVVCGKQVARMSVWDNLFQGGSDFAESDALHVDTPANHISCEAAC